MPRRSVYSRCSAVGGVRTGIKLPDFVFGVCRFVKIAPKTYHKYQIYPREAVPEVSKGKGYINQEKMCL